VDTAFPFWNAGAVLDLADLRAFARIADLGSVSAAARALKAPKSSVSRSLARLEQAVGAVLVERSTRRLRLTDAGALLRPHARRILNDVDEAETALGGFGGVPRGLLRVNATYAFAQGVLAPMLPPFLARHPEVRVALDIENRRIDPMAEEADLVIRLGPLADSALIARRLAVLEVWLCASPAYLAARGTPARAADLARHDMIMRSDRAERWELRDGRRPRGGGRGPPARGLGRARGRARGHRGRRWHRPRPGLPRGGCHRRRQAGARAALRRAAPGRGARALPEPPQPFGQGAGVHRRAGRTPRRGAFRARRPERSRAGRRRPLD
jgi:DNA-binding transcriptional LysR family regulator